ncbi:MAG TPA: hypothetical protein VLE99_02845 [Candidatus Saccharimonadales bacterium]|nr:hypothetical protein [Candidatus Saccharimonadales bacterium]
MKRTYLEEDMELIQKYFPGARSVALRTPFDLTQRGARIPRLAPGSFHDPGAVRTSWKGGVLWMN